MVGGTGGGMTVDPRLNGLTDCISRQTGRTAHISSIDITGETGALVEPAATAVVPRKKAAVVVVVVDCLAAVHASCRESSSPHPSCPSPRL